MIAQPPAKIDKSDWVVVEKKGPIESDIWGVYCYKFPNREKKDSFVYKNMCAINANFLDKWSDRMDEVRMMKIKHKGIPYYIMVDKSLKYIDSDRGIETWLKILYLDSLVYKNIFNYINSNDTTLKEFTTISSDYHIKKAVEKKNALVDNFIYKPEEFNLIYYTSGWGKANYPKDLSNERKVILIKNDGKYIHFTRQILFDEKEYRTDYNWMHFYIEKEKILKMFVID